MVRKADTPKNIVVAVRIPYKQYALLEAVRAARGDDHMSATMRAAITGFCERHLKTKAGASQ